MDEPLGALDKQLREHMQYEIKHLHDRLGVTVVYVTHDQSEALTMSDRIAVFNDGVIQQLAPPSDLYERPDNAFVAQFIGENNKLNGVIEAPERVLIGASGENTTTAKVKELIYLGDHIRCRMDVAGHDEFIVKVPNAAGTSHLSVGEETVVSWQTADCRALDGA